MNVAPLIHTTPAIQIHVAAALATVILTVLIFTRARGTRAHRVLGWSWVVAMGVVAASSFGIYSFQLLGPFSPIHALSLVVLVSLVTGVRAARGQRIGEHRRTMLTMVWAGVVVTGLFTLLPGRIMHGVLFGV